MRALHFIGAARRTRGSGDVVDVLNEDIGKRRERRVGEEASVGRPRRRNVDPPLDRDASDVFAIVISDVDLLCGVIHDAAFHAFIAAIRNEGDASSRDARDALALVEVVGNEVRTLIARS